MTPDEFSASAGSELVDWRALPPGQRRAWWERLWDDAIALSNRYRLALRRAWWEDPIQVEALAAFCCWLRLYDTGAETDPTGKLQLLWELDRLRLLLRAGDEPFDRDQDRPRFVEHLARADADHDPRGFDRPVDGSGHGLSDELDVIQKQLHEVQHRERVLAQAAAEGDVDQPRNDLRELRAAKRQLLARRHDLQRRLERERET